MKKIFILFILTISLSKLLACDICGCSSGNYFLGPMPKFNKFFIDTRYSYRNFSSILATDNTQFSNDFYETVEVWGGYKINNKFQILAFLPFNNNNSTTDDGTRSQNGFGDVTVIGNYTVFNRMSMTDKDAMVSQQLSFGGGVKFPTGAFAIDTAEIISSSSHQAGTGSVDFILTSAYNLNISNWGISSNITYKMNGTASEFKFGNRVAASTFVYRNFGSRSAIFSPNVGLTYQYQNANELRESPVASTGGYSVLGTVGLEARFGKITAGANVQLPVSQNISDGQTKINSQGMVHVGFSF